MADTYIYQLGCTDEHESTVTLRYGKIMHCPKHGKTAVYRLERIEHGELPQSAQGLYGNGNHPAGDQYGPADMTMYDRHRADPGL